MRISEILTHSVTDTVARHYKEASASTDAYYNPEAVDYMHKNREYYQKYFAGSAEPGATPVFTDQVDKPGAKYTAVPKRGQRQSPGYRGLQYTRARAGLDYDRNTQAPDRGSSIALGSSTQSGMPAVHHGGY